MYIVCLKKDDMMPAVWNSKQQKNLDVLNMTLNCPIGWSIWGIYSEYVCLNGPLEQIQAKIPMVSDHFPHQNDMLGDSLCSDTPNSCFNMFPPFLQEWKNYTNHA